MLDFCTKIVTNIRFGCEYFFIDHDRSSQLEACYNCRLKKVIQSLNLTHDYQHERNGN